MRNSSRWLDVRGNHDNANLDDRRNHHYHAFSNSGDREYVYVERYPREFGTYCFVGIDTTISPCTSVSAAVDSISAYHPPATAHRSPPLPPTPLPQRRR